MSPGRFEGLLKAIAGFEMHITEWRGTAKIDQDKPDEVRERIAAALTDRGEQAMAALYSSPSPDGEGNHAQHGGGVISADLDKLPLHHPSADGCYAAGSGSRHAPGMPTRLHSPPHASRREE
jgi:hypothetical protein